jgi:hypothetical protein
MARPALRLVLSGALIAGSAVVGIQTAAWASAPWWCYSHASAPTFDGSMIDGNYWVTCLAPIQPRKLFGRIKEDRPLQPDVVHKTEYIWFRDDMGDHISKRTCQDDDSIYIESQVRGGDPTQSGRRTMHC